MTALSEYERLEAPGLWRDAAGSQRRDVIVSFGEATLVIADGRTARALAHWSLPAVERRNPGAMPAILAPGPDSTEELEIDDPSMIAAIAKVHTLIEARKPHPGRLRLALLLSGLGIVAAAVLFFIPGAVVGHTVKVVPAETRAEIGQALLTDVFRVTGAACAAPEGREALARLNARLSGAGLAESGGVIVLASGLQGARHLPGGAILVGRELVERETSPDVLAGHILAERSRAATADSLTQLLDWTGVRPAFALLTTGNLPKESMVGYAEALLSRVQPDPDPQDLLRRFAAAGVPASPYAAKAVIGDTVRDALRQGDPYADGTPDVPLLGDSDWVALQGICGG